LNTLAAPRTYTVSPQAYAQAKALGWGGDVNRRLIRMARRAAPVTHEYGNRRFDDFVLWIEDRHIKAVSHY
jgi:hypothetical protein